MNVQWTGQILEAIDYIVGRLERNSHCMDKELGDGQLVRRAVYYPEPHYNVEPCCIMGHVLWRAGFISSITTNPGLSLVFQNIVGDHQLGVAQEYANLLSYVTNANDTFIPEKRGEKVIQPLRNLAAYMRERLKVTAETRVTP